MAKPFRFAVQSFNADSGEDWANQAQRAEELGYLPIKVENIEKDGKVTIALINSLKGIDY